MAVTRSSPFVVAAVKSGLFPESRIIDLLAKAPTTSTATPSAFAGHLVATDELTQFQADKLNAGLWQGLTLGPYRVLAPIGRGGMGVVYLAARGETNAGQHVALKILPPRVAREEPRRLERFLRELRIGKSIPSHRHIAQTIDGGDVAGVHYLVMDYAPGPTLRKHVQDHGPLPIAEASAIHAAVADALTHIHARKIVHRDLKPANIILAPNNEPKLLDFGFAIVSGEPLPADPRIAGGQGYTIGTMDYIAPEQIRDASSVTPGSDLYSLGCSLFYALTGTPPYPGGDAQQKLRWHQSSEPPDVRTIAPNVPEGLAAIVSKLLQKEPDKRFRSAGDVREALMEQTGSTVVTINPVGFETAVYALAHQKVATEELLEPIILDDNEPNPTPKRNEPPPDTFLFWLLMAGLTLLVMIFIAAIAFLLTTQK
jgi:serine/threonine protein kinase